MAALLDAHSDSPYFREMALTGVYEREESDSPNYCEVSLTGVMILVRNLKNCWQH
jgi:hypothetical protein